MPAVVEPRAGISLGASPVGSSGGQGGSHVQHSAAVDGRLLSTPMVKSAPGSQALGRKAWSILSESLTIPLLTRPPQSLPPLAESMQHSFPLCPPIPSRQPFHLYGSCLQ